jgi:hypothetical protein
VSGAAGGEEALLRDYRTALLRHLGFGGESTLLAGYELGRGALAAERSLLEVVRVHHLVLAEVLAEEPAERVPAVAAAASDFLLEVLASYDMARRDLPHEPRPGAPQQSQPRPQPRPRPRPGGRGPAGRG